MSQTRLMWMVHAHLDDSDILHVLVIVKKTPKNYLITSAQASALNISSSFSPSRNYTELPGWHMFPLCIILYIFLPLPNGQKRRTGSRFSENNKHSVFVTVTSGALHRWMESKGVQNYSVFCILKWCQFNGYRLLGVNGTFLWCNAETCVPAPPLAYRQMFLWRWRIDE